MESTADVGHEPDSQQDTGSYSDYELANEKHVIVDCSENAEIHERIDAVEASVQDLGTHVVRYQQDLTAILVQECYRIREQIQHHKDRLNQNMHEEVSKVRNQFTEEIRAQCGCIWECLQTSKQLSNEAAGAKCKEETSTGETPSTASSSEGLETRRDITRGLYEVSKDIGFEESDSNVHVNATKRRLERWDTCIGAEKDVKNSSHVCPAEFSFRERGSQRWAHEVAESSLKEAATVPSVSVSLEAQLHIASLINSVHENIDVMRSDLDALFSNAIDVVRSDLDCHVNATEKRLAALENGPGIQHGANNNAIHNSSEFNLSDQRKRIYGMLGKLKGAQARKRSIPRIPRGNEEVPAPGALGQSVTGLDVHCDARCGERYGLFRETGASKDRMESNTR